MNGKRLLYSKEGFIWVFMKNIGKWFPLKNNNNTEMGCYTPRGVEDGRVALTLPPARSQLAWGFFTQCHARSRSHLGEHFLSLGSQPLWNKGNWPKMPKLRRSAVMWGEKQWGGAPRGQVPALLPVESSPVNPAETTRSRRTAQLFPSHTPDPEKQEGNKMVVWSP